MNKITLITIFFFTKCLFAQENQGDQFGSYNNYLIGVWQADNSKYKNENEPYDVYQIEWAWETDKESIRAELFGITNGEKSKPFWTFRQYWDSTEQKIIVSQYSPDGTMGTGYLAKKSGDTISLKQYFISPSGTFYSTGHKNIIKSDEEYTGSSFNIDDKNKWLIQRTYTWKKMKNSLDKNIEIAKKSFEAFNKHDWQLHSSYFSDSCKYLDPSYGNEYKTVNRKDKADKYREMEKKSPDIKDEVTEIFGVNDKVVIQFTSSGTFQTENGPVKWSLPICCIFTFKNGLIIKDETYYNRGK